MGKKQTERKKGASCRALLRGTDAAPVAANDGWDADRDGADVLRVTGHRVEFG